MKLTINDFGMPINDGDAVRQALAARDERIAALVGDLAHAQRIASGATQLVKQLEARIEQAESERDEERARLDRLDENGYAFTYLVCADGVGRWHRPDPSRALAAPIPCDSVRECIDDERAPIDAEKAKP